MYSDKLLLLKLDDIQGELYQLNNSLNVSDSLVVTKLSDMSTSLSDISSCYLEQSHNTFFGVPWAIAIPIIIFIIGHFINSLRTIIERKRDRELVKNAIVIWGNENIPILERYINYIKDLSNKIKKSDEMLPQAFRLQHITVDVLSSFTIDRLTDSLHRGIKEKKEEKDSKLNLYLSNLSFILNVQPEVRINYNNYNKQCNQLLREWNVRWAAYKKDIWLNFVRTRALSHFNVERIYYVLLVHQIQTVMIPSLYINPSLSSINNLFIKIGEIDKLVSKNSSPMIETEFLAGEVAETLKHISAMKEYSKVFSDLADNIDKSVRKFKETIRFYSEWKIRWL